VEACLDLIDGVTEITPGYAGGFTTDPTYREVCSGSTGHAEVVRVRFDPDAVSLEDILEVFFEAHDPTTPDRQGADVGTQYRSIVLATSEEQKFRVEELVEKLRQEFTAPIVTEIEMLGDFYPAEKYHQRYYESNPHAPYCRMVIKPKLKKVRQKISP
jgi:peptide-methionine (S)-S-oxide reductase